MARLSYDALLDFIAFEGEEAFLGELRRMGHVPAPIQLCEGEVSADDALSYAVALRALGQLGQAQEIVEAVVGASMRCTYVNHAMQAAEA